MVGGDGSLSTALQFHEAGLPVVGVPKTIDNDLSCTAFTFGFNSAVLCCADALDRLHTTAASHGRVMVLEVMGRHTGWIALHGGIAGGGDVILIPEIPWTYDNIMAKIDERTQLGRNFTLIVVAEGAELPDGSIVDVNKPATCRSSSAESAPSSRRNWSNESNRKRPLCRARPLAARRRADDVRPCLGQPCSVLMRCD